MKVLIAYESQAGHTRQAAQAIAEAVRKQGGDVVLKKFVDVNAADVQTADVLFLGTWIRGYILFGTRPAGAEQWVAALPSLTRKSVAVFCTCLFHPLGALNRLSAMLRERGAEIKGEQVFRRSRPGQGAEQFVQRVLQASRRSG